MKHFFAILFMLVLLPLLSQAQSGNGWICYVESGPDFPGGEQQLCRFIRRYIPHDTTISFILTFSIDKMGIIKLDTVLINNKPIDTSKAVHKMAYQLLKDMPRWGPYKQRDTPMVCRYNLPIVARRLYELR